MITHNSKKEQLLEEISSQRFFLKKKLSQLYSVSDKVDRFSGSLYRYRNSFIVATFLIATMALRSEKKKGSNLARNLLRVYGGKQYIKNFIHNTIS